MGSKILSYLAQEAKKLQIDSILANISSLNKVSIAFHKNRGFKNCGTFRRIGRKRGRDFDVVWMQKKI